MHKTYYTRTQNGFYKILVQPDIAVRGGALGAGTTTTVWKLADDGATDCRGYQGSFSKTRVRALIAKMEAL